MGGLDLPLRLLLAPLLLLVRQLPLHLLLSLQQVSQASAVAVLLPCLVLSVTVVWMPRAAAAAGCSGLLLQQQRQRRLPLGQQLVHMLHLRRSGEAGTVQLGGLWAQAPPAEGSVPAIAAARLKLLATVAAAPIIATSKIKLAIKKKKDSKYKQAFQ